MKNPLRILHVEDSPKDAELVENMLQQEGIVCEVLRVDTRADYVSALEQRAFDLILGDYSMPGFDGLSALKLSQEKRPGVPFIFVSGTLGEDVAIEALKHGAIDYVLKDRLSRFIPCVRRALRQVEEQKERKLAQEALQESEARKKAMLEGALDAIIAIDHQGKILEFNPTAERTFGYTLDQVIGKPMADVIIPPHLRERHKQGLKHYIATGEGLFIGKAVEVTAMRADGTEFPAELGITPIGEKWPPMFLGHVRDITAQKRAEQEIILLQSITKAVSEAEDLSSALVATLRLVCQTTGWICGEVWMPRPDGKLLESAPVWYSSVEGLDTFMRLSKEFKFPPGVGLPGRVWVSKNPLWLRDIRQEENFPRKAIIKETGLRTAMGIPIRTADEVVAIMNFFAFEPRAEDERLTGLVSTVSAQLGLVFSRKLAEDRERKNIERIRALHEIDLAITSTLDLHTILNVLLEKIEIFLSYPCASTVRLMNRQTGVLEALACRGLNEEEWKAQDSRSLGERAKKVVETKAPLIVRNVQTDPQTSKPEIFRNLGVPLIAQSETLGVLGVYTKEEHEFTLEEVEFLNTLAGQAAIAIHNAQLYEQMARANKIKDEFLSVMSHELRTPLNVVVGYAGMIKDGLLGEVNPQQTEGLGKIIDRANDQLAMVNNILYATVLEAEKIKVDSQPIVLGDFFKQLGSAYEALLNKPVSFNWDCACPLSVIHTDSAKLKQILHNLIDNAIKFTSKGSVTISARITEGRKQKAEGSQQGEEELPTANRLLPTGGGQWVEFAVADTGVGIPKEHLPYIFEKFRQVDSSETRSFGGVGMGLYIVRKFTEMLGGTVEVESEPGKGSAFTVTLPVNP